MYRLVDIIPRLIHNQVSASGSKTWKGLSLEEIKQNLSTLLKISVCFQNVILIIALFSSNLSQTMLVLLCVYYNGVVPCDLLNE